MEDNKRKGLGMVLEGGGMRGLYTAGVLDELMEQGIYADSTVGVSAGAIFGCNLLLFFQFPKVAAIIV